MDLNPKHYPQINMDKPSVNIIPNINVGYDINNIRNWHMDLDSKHTPQYK